MPSTTPKLSALLKRCCETLRQIHDHKKPAATANSTATTTLIANPDTKSDNSGPSLPTLIKLPTVSTPMMSPKADSSSSVVFTASRTCICCNTGMITVLLVQPKTAPSNKLERHDMAMLQCDAAATAPKLRA